MDKQVTVGNNLGSELVHKDTAHKSPSILKSDERPRCRMSHRSRRSRQSHLPSANCSSCSSWRRSQATGVPYTPPDFMSSRVCRRRCALHSIGLAVSRSGSIKRWKKPCQVELPISEHKFYACITALALASRPHEGHTMDGSHPGTKSIVSQ